MLRPRLRFGIFMAPFHPVAREPDASASSATAS